MIKAVIICISLCVGCFTTLFFSRYLSYKWSISKLQDTPNHLLSNTSQFFYNDSMMIYNYNESHPVIKSLMGLIQIPFFGQFFLDQKIYELAKLQNWEAVAKQSTQIVKTSANKYSFEVWYHKALAECSLGLLQECEDSIKSVQLLGGNKIHRIYSASLYKYLDSIKKGYKKQFRVQIEL